MEQKHGFIHDMLDVKVLILFLMSRVQYPVTADKLFELAYQDDCLNYFDVAQALWRFPSCSGSRPQWSGLTGSAAGRTMSTSR